MIWFENTFVIGITDSYVRKFKVHTINKRRRRQMELSNKVSRFCLIYTPRNIPVRQNKIVKIRFTTALPKPPPPERNPRVLYLLVIANTLGITMSPMGQPKHDVSFSDLPSLFLNTFILTEWVSPTS